MTMTKDSDEEWANSAKDLLVTLAKTSRFTGAVMDALLQKFPPGLTVPPHRYVIIAFAAVAEHNAAGFLPFLTDILSRTVPLLTHIRTESLRCCWSQGIVSFVKAIFEVVATSCPEDSVEADESSDHDIVSNYTDQMEAIYETVMLWIASKDSKVRADAAECIGRLCLLINGQRLNQDLKKLVTIFLTLYRKAFPDEYYTITKAVCAFVEALCLEETRPFEYYFDDLLNALFPHVCTLAEQSLSNEEAFVSSETMKMQTEIFQCFSTVSSRFADRIVYFLLHKMQNAQDSVKLGAISVMRHLLNFSKNLCECERIILMGLKPLLVDEHNQLSFVVRKCLCQLCVAFCDNLHLSADIGGMNVISFIVANMVSPTDVSKRVLTDHDQANLSQLNLQCAQALHTIASDCKLESKLLFPYLFEFICMEPYNLVVAYIMKSLSAFIERSEEKLDFEEGFDNPRVAGKHQILTRIFVCLSRAPLNAQLTTRAQEAIRLLKNLWTWFSPDLSKVVQGDLDTLSNALKELGPSGSHQEELKWTRVEKWHAHVLDFLAAVMKAEKSGDWRSNLAAAMGKQLHLYSQLPHEKAFLMRCLGSMLTGYTNTSFVSDHIILLFKETNHENRVERVGCAMAVGFCAQTHTDLVLTELENVAKWEHTRKASSGFFSFIKDAIPYKGTPTDMVYLRSTLMLSFGYVIRYCPSDVVIQRLEQNVLIFLKNYLDVTKQEVTVREALLEAINLIAQAVHPQNLGCEYKLEARTQLYNFISENVQAESKEMLTNSIRLLAAKALASLIKLDPVITDNELWDLGNVLTNYIIPIHREKSGLKTSSETHTTTLPRRRPPSYMESEPRSRSISYHRRLVSSSSASVQRIDDDESSTMMEATMVQFRNAVEVMIVKRPVVDTVSQLLKMLIPYYGSVADHERLRAVDTTVLVLRVYLDTATDIAIGN
ncbi:hypothetical protein L596_029241 [Steinernema carpocapsae]|uniref:Uncharacterized protein n=1 Tax=Steinernema carpocapsae TaxID=34508 RepID=A0A4U5LU15_STECR|nr:hypothetical protein L596_029241 [Steinernema carpocapsae]